MYIVMCCVEGCSDIVQFVMNQHFCLENLSSFMALAIGM